MMKTLALCLLWICFVANDGLPEEVVSYKGWEVIDVSGTKANEVGEKFSTEELDGLLFLEGDVGTGAFQIAVSPQKKQEIWNYLSEKGLKINTQISDLGMLIEAVAFRTDYELQGKSTFDRYMDHKEIEEYTHQLQEIYHDKVKVASIGKSFEGKDINMVQISNGITSTNPQTGLTSKPVIFIESGVHAREWISPASSLYIIEKLLTDDKYTNTMEWRIIPLSNPDGYIYTWNKDRLWRKNRSVRVGDRCVGTDLNRNFGSHWAEIGVSNSSCSSIFGGRVAFSEPESTAIREAVLQIKDRLKGYVSVHSYSQLILFPYGYRSSNLPRREEKYLSIVAEEMAFAVLNSTKQIYKAGRPTKILYPASGLSMDWVKEVTGAPLVYTLELRDKGKFGFVLPKEQIKDSVEEAWLMVEVIAKETITQKRRLQVSPESSLNSDPSLNTDSDSTVQSENPEGLNTNRYKQEQPNYINKVSVPSSGLETKMMSPTSKDLLGAQLSDVNPTFDKTSE